MKIFLCRHGQALDDLNNTFGGWADDELTSAGVNESKILAKKLSEKGIQKIFSSSLKRAKQTAEIIGNELKLASEFRDDLREMNKYGFLTGMNKDWAKKHYPDIVEKIKEWNYSVEGGESIESFTQRLSKFIDLLNSLEFESVCIVTHTGPIWFVTEMILEKRINLGNADFIELEI